MALPKTSLTNLFSVEGLIVLITGGGSGLGLIMAKAFALNGAKVFITGRRGAVLEDAAQEILAESGNTIQTIVADITVRESLTTILAALDGKLDVLINNAGIVVPDAKSSHTTALKDLQAAMLSSPSGTWSSTFSCNVEAPYFLSVGCLHLLAASKLGGRIINITSIGGRMSDPNVHQPAYQVSKAAADHLTRLLASKFREHGVRVNAIAPGYFVSAMNDPNNPNSMISKAKVLVPLKRGGDEVDLAGTAIWLASPAGSYMTGQHIVLDGGRSWS